MSNSKKKLTIIIDGDIETDYRELFSGKSLKKIKQPENTLYLDSYAQLHKLLSPKKIDLLRYLISDQNNKNPKSISEIAIKTHRHQEAISRDIKDLEKLGFVNLKRLKQTVYAFSEYAGINIRMG